MTEMNMREWIAGVINRSDRIAVPVMTHPGIELLGRTVREAVSDGRVHYEAIKALNDRYPAAACTTIMDLTVEAEAFGARVHFPEDEIPSVTGRLLSSEEDVAGLGIPDTSAGRVPQYLLAARLAAENIPGKPVFGGMTGPFTLAGRLYDMSEFMMACIDEPDTAELLLEKCTAWLTGYGREIRRQGAQGVIIAEPAAGLLSNNLCSTYSSAYIKEIVDALQDDSFMVILHNCGNTGHCTRAMSETGAWGYHFGNVMNMTDALQAIPPTALVMGNLDPVSLFRSGTSAEVHKATTELLEQTAPFPNFVLSTGCDVPPHVPHENIEAFYEALSAWNGR